MEQFVLIASGVFLVVGTAHLLRAALSWPLVVSTYSVPRVLSFVGGLVLLILSWWGFSQLP